MKKTQAIFATFTARYGNPTLKDGQDVQAIAHSFESSLGHYAMKDLEAACTSWMQGAKFPRWPEPAELIEILRSFGAIPEEKQIDTEPMHLKQARMDAAKWYANVIRRPLPNGAWPLRWEDAVIHIIGADDLENYNVPFSFSLTNAWMKGVIPNHFDRKADEYFAQMNVRKAKYLDAVKKHGAAPVNERWVKF